MSPICFCFCLWFSLALADDCVSPFSVSSNIKSKLNRLFMIQFVFICLYHRAVICCQLFNKVYFIVNGVCYIPLLIKYVLYEW